MLWTGRVVSCLVALSMLLDGIMKLVKDPHVLQAMAKLEWPDALTRGLGILVLTCTILYAIPRTSIFGAILLTAWLGGATAAKTRLEDPTLFISVAMGVLVWGGLFLRDARVRALIPIRLKTESGTVAKVTR
ncbi:MAG TPA: DoxX family protein [Opitutaceae bacterium]|nr:DoxX family protein [Opitutaceae bacterium]